MSRDQRIALIQELERVRGSRVLALVAGDRPGLETRVAQDMIPLVARHLRAIGVKEHLDIFLYSTGGDVLAGYRLVGLLREYCTKKLSVLVPFRCQSTATLISLGADEIVMLPQGQLSPVDPSITGPYNPMVPGIPIQPGAPLPLLPVSVEEVVSYVHLAKEIGGVQGEAGLVTVFELLTKDVRPMALGQVYRARTQIRMLSKKLLQTHMHDVEEQRIDETVKMLTESLYSHDYLISRREARSIGLNAVDPKEDTERAMSSLYDQYAIDLMLGQPFSPVAALQGQQRVDIGLERAYIETTDRADAFVTERILIQAGPGQIMEQNIFEGWRSI